MDELKCKKMLRSHRRLILPVLGCSALLILLFGQVVLPILRKEKHSASKYKSLEFQCNGPSQEGFLSKQSSIISNYRAENKIFKKPFAYYILTEHCLPKELLQKTALGDGTNLDVYVNSYQEPCITNSSKHVTYIYDNTTSWTTGRNMLYFYVKDTGKRYQYHIFMDDDVLLFYTLHMAEFSHRQGIPRGNSEFVQKYLTDPQGFSQAVVEKRQGKSAWRSFEEDLIANSPAFSTVNYLRLGGFESFLVQDFFWKKSCPPETKVPCIATSYYVDFSFGAYHEQALPMLMPYSALFESVSWWISTILAIFRHRVILARQCVSNYKIAVINRAHRPYPKNDIPENVVSQYVREEAPELHGQIEQEFQDLVIVGDSEKHNRFLFGDPSICLAPLKFPVGLHYSHARQKVKTKEKS